MRAAPANSGSMKSAWVLASAFLLAFVTPPSRAFGALPLETESARIMPAGTLKVESAFEWQTSSGGKEIGLPLAIEYAFLDDFELQVEPVFYTAILPKVGTKSEGVGDLEATATARFLREKGLVPNMALAAEVKFPTARNLAIGTREYDYTGYLIVSKRFFEKLDLHLNAGYTFVGSPPGTKLTNTFDYAAALDFHATDKLDLLTELLGNTASAPELPDGSEQTGLTAEASGGELVGLIGARYQVLPGFYPSLGVTYDNQAAVMIRAGLTWKFALFPEGPVAAPAPVVDPSVQ